MKKIFVLIVTLLFLNHASAATNCNGSSMCSGPAQELVTGFFPHDNNGTKMLLVNSPIAVSGLPCTGNNGGTNLIIDETNAVFEEVTAFLLAAHMNNSNLIISIDSSQTTCTINNVRIVN